jgi:hypothetical protein
MTTEGEKPMDYQEAVLAYRKQIAHVFSTMEPRPSDDWIAEQVDKLWPLQSANGDGRTAQASLGAAANSRTAYGGGSRRTRYPTGEPQTT